MKLEEVRVIAKYYRVKFDGLSENEIIHNIQRQGGHADGTALCEMVRR